MLYPGEKLANAPNFGVTSSDYSAGIVQLPVVPPNHAIRLQARVDVMRGERRVLAGDQWQVMGPITYYPEADVVSEAAMTFHAPLDVVRL